jgi:AcrR family transcriptional regulator
LSAPAERAALGLRERKKAKTRAAIQTEALRLFLDQGYAQTTVEQICEAAEVSESTFFRYFPTKEDVVAHDRYDPLLIAAFHAQPAELTPIQAIRGAMHSVFDQLPTDELAHERERGRLITSVPELRAKALEQLTETLEMLADLLASRSGREAGNFAVRNLTGALIGVAIATTLAAAEDPTADYFQLFDAGLAHLEAGLPL